jgi:hypothetical protein
MKILTEADLENQLSGKKSSNSLEFRAATAKSIKKIIVF